MSAPDTTRFRREVRPIVERDGFSLADVAATGGGHWRVTVERAGARFFVIVGKTPSRRWRDNLSKDIRREYARAQHGRTYGRT